MSESLSSFTLISDWESFTILHMYRMLRDKEAIGKSTLWDVYVFSWGVIIDSSRLAPLPCTGCLSPARILSSVHPLS